MRCCRPILRAAVAALIATITLSGCAFFSLKNWFDGEGEVRYRDINKGAPHVHVLAVWRGQNTEKENTFECYHVYATQTDTDGKFFIKGWREYFSYSHLNEKKMSLIIYKPGFWSEELLRHAPTERDNKYYIEGADDKNGQTNSSKRLKYLQKMVGLASCDVHSPTRSQLRPMFEDILSEAEPLAKSPLDKKILASIKTWTLFVSPQPKKKKALAEEKPASKPEKKSSKKKVAKKEDDKKADAKKEEKKKVQLMIVKPPTK